MSSLTSPDGVINAADDPNKRRRPPVTSTQRAVRIVVLVVFWLTAVIITLVALGSTKIPTGTTVGGVEIGGLDRQSAINKLDASFDQQTNAPVTLKISETTTRVPVDALGISPNFEATVDSVMTTRWNPFDMWRGLRGGGSGDIAFDIDQATLDGKLDALTQQYSQRAKEPQITYVGTTPQLTEPVVGKTIDRQAAPGVLLTHYLRAKGPIEMPIAEQQPTVSLEQARQALDGVAKTAVSAPVTVKVGDVSAEASPAAIAAALTFQVKNDELRPVIDGAQLHAALGPALAKVDTRARDATWDVTSGKPVLVPAQPGNGVTDEHVADSVASVLDKQADQRRVEMPLGPLNPKLSTEDAAALNIKEKVSSFTQKFPYAPYRFQNIGQASKKVNKTLLKPGEVFSLNKIVGERTKANGFTEGLVVGEGGRFQEDMGGGVSAAATTLWTAAFYAGLERVEQGSHLIWISRYRPGLEATVAWGQLDLKFKNDTPAGILITTKMTKTGLTVNMWGEKQYDAVKAVSGPKMNTKPFSKEEASGPSCVEQAGVPGFSIEVDRLFYKGAEQVKKQTFTTTYIPAAQVTCVKEPAKPKKTAPTPAPAAAR